MTKIMFAKLHAAPQGRQRRRREREPCFFGRRRGQTPFIKGFSENGHPQQDGLAPVAAADPPSLYRV
jgi:hypothetical protein